MKLPRLLLTLVSAALLSNVACGVKSGAPSGPSPTPTPTPTATVTASQPSGVQAASSITFSVETANFQAGGLNYRWDFGDGETSTDEKPVHIFLSAGQHTVVVTVSNAQQSARSELSVDIFGLSGTWLQAGAGTTTMRFTQTGRLVVGEASVATGPGDRTPYTGCAVTGTVQSGPPFVVILLSQPPCPGPRGLLTHFDYRLNITINGQRISGTRSSPVPPVTVPITLDRQP